MKNKLYKSALKTESLPAHKVTYGLAGELGFDDVRQPTFKKQREKRGFDSTELWSLYTTISKFIYPRLVAFKNETICVPGCLDTREQWDSVLDKMINAFKIISEDRQVANDSEYYLVEDGLDLFRKYFCFLWY